MKIILDRGGNLGTRRFEASASPQDVPDKFGRDMIVRGLARQVEDTAPATTKSTTKATKATTKAST